MANNDTKQKFIKHYQKLQLGIREEPIIVINDRPITWNVVYCELTNNTSMSHKLLEEIETLNIFSNETGFNNKGLSDLNSLGKENLKKIALKKLDTVSDSFRMSIASDGTFNKVELVNHIKRDDDVGKTFLEMEIFYIRNAQKSFQTR